MVAQAQLLVNKHRGLHSYLKMNLKPLSLEIFLSRVCVFLCTHLCVPVQTFLETGILLLLIEVLFDPLLLSLDTLGKTTRCWCVIHVTKATTPSVCSQLWMLYQQMAGNVK